MSFCDLTELLTDTGLRSCNTICTWVLLKQRNMFLSQNINTSFYIKWYNFSCIGKKIVFIFLGGKSTFWGSSVFAFSKWLGLNEKLAIQKNINTYYFFGVLAIPFLWFLRTRHPFNLCPILYWSCAHYFILMGLHVSQNKYACNKNNFRVTCLGKKGF